MKKESTTLDFEAQVRNYISSKYGKDAQVKAIDRLGSGFVATAYKVVVRVDGEEEVLIFRKLNGIGMSKDYISDQIGNFVLQHQIANTLPNHIASYDVVAFDKQGKPVSLGDVEGTFQVIELAEGVDYSEMLEALGSCDRLIAKQRAVIDSILDALLQVHAIKPQGFSDEQLQNFYWRHSQDFIGSEVYLDVIDAYPSDAVFTRPRRYGLLAALGEYRHKQMHLHPRISRIHGDLHPGNIRVYESGDIKFLDASRAMWGEPADDIASMIANYLKQSLVKRGDFSGDCAEAAQRLWTRYKELSGDQEIDRTWAMFLAVRLIILANPAFFSDNSAELEEKLVCVAEQALGPDSLSLQDVIALTNTVG